MWRIEDTVASLALNGLSAMVRLDCPRRGLIDARHRNETLSNFELLGARFGVDGDEGTVDGLVEAHVRGTDLIASYGRDRHLTAQIYWRAIPQLADLPVLGVELIVSTQTDLLDIHPCVFLGSQIKCDEVLCLRNAEAGFESLDWQSPNTASDIGVYIFRLANGHASYVEMVHPDDLLHACLHFRSSEPTLVNSEYRVLDEQMEKGVIRRNRMRGLWLDRANDEETAIELYREFVESTIPLDA